jgi:hypothetical protein
MSISPSLRQAMFLLGLALVAVGLLFDGSFANDVGPPIEVPEPDALALMGLGGAAMMVASLVRRRKK